MGLKDILRWDIAKAIALENNYSIEVHNSRIYLVELFENGETVETFDTPDEVYYFMKGFDFCKKVLLKMEK